MARCWLLPFVFLFVTAIFAQTPSTCSNNGLAENTSQCGSNAFCNDKKNCECVSGYFTPDGTASDCRNINEPDPTCFTFSSECVYCGSSYEGPCLKCTEFITLSGECVNDCDEGYQITVFPNSTLSARVCEDSTTRRSAVIPQWAIIVIAVMSGLLILTGLVILLVISFIWFNRASSGQFQVEDTNTSLVPPESVQLPHHFEQGKTSQGIDDGEGSNEFFSKLSNLRSHAEVYLSMLNDMRRRLKELPPDAPTAQQYRNVMRDVTRLLYLLNKRSSAIEIPPDGLQLLSWSEQILQRYLVSQEGSPRGTSTRIPNRLSAVGDQAETNF